VASVLTRSDIERLTLDGTVHGQRYELIEGQLIRKSGQSPSHAVGLSSVLWQFPIEVASEDRERNEPEPDLAVIADPGMDSIARHPRGDELLLLVEIADTTAGFDRIVKSALYARASIREYWLVDLPTRALYVHRHPSRGIYRHVIRLAEDETLAPDSRPDAVVKVSELLPPAPRALS